MSLVIRERLDSGDTINAPVDAKGGVDRGDETGPEE